LSEQTRGAYAILEQKIPAGHGPPLHVHRHETEIFYILEGEFEVTIGGQKVSAPAGAIVVGPRDIPHTFRNVGSQDGRLLLTVIPGRFPTSSSKWMVWPMTTTRPFGRCVPSTTSISWNRTARGRNARDCKQRGAALVAAR
jgi:quercetin dioxygenase-like cupin family protein